METYLCMHAQISSDICPRACSYVHRNERVTHAPRYTCTHIDRHRHRHRHKHVSICRHVENTCYVAHDSPEIDPVLLSFACGKTGCCANRRGQAMETKISRRVMIKEVGEIKVSSPLISCHLITSHLISSYLVLSHLISTQLISSHFIYISISPCAYAYLRANRAYPGTIGRATTMTAKGRKKQKYLMKRSATLL